MRFDCMQLMLNESLLIKKNILYNSLYKLHRTKIGRKHIKYGSYPIINWYSYLKVIISKNIKP